LACTLKKDDDDDDDYDDTKMLYLEAISIATKSYINAVDLEIRGFIQKFLDWPPGARTENGTALCHYVQLYRYFVSFSATTTCVASQRVFIIVSVCFFMDSVRRLLNTPS
jgi:hypothetical protein